MIRIKELNDFAKIFVAERPNLENYFVVASDDELVKLYKDTVNDRDDCSLVVVVPNYDSEVVDEDNRRMRNNLYFMVVKKTDAKAGHEEKIDIFGITQEEIRALLIKVIDLHHNFQGSCLFRDIDLNSFQIDPVQDYIGANGYQIEFTTKSAL